MLGATKWSCTPYRPLCFDGGDIYVCRIAPGEDSCHVEWLSCGTQPCTVYLKRRDAADFSRVVQADGNAVDFTGLERDTDYAFQVVCGEKKSRTRLFRTGTPVGTVVNYLHPEDDAYAFSGHYLCSPSMVRHPDGYLLSSMDVFAGGAPQNLTLIFRSDDDGKSWHYVTDLFPCFWGRLFIHRGEVYMLACSTEYGDLLIGKSPDGGKTFDTPTVLLRGSGRCDTEGVHKNPQPPVYYGGRLYETLEWGAWAKGYHAAMVMSIDENGDLLDPAQWHFTPPLKYDPAWPGVAEGPSAGCIEGTLCVAPDGRLLNVMRYDMSRCRPNYGLALAFEVNTADPDAPLTFDRAIPFPGNHSKFMIRRDERTGRYYAIISRILNEKCAGHRNLLSLMASEDLNSWRVVTDLIDRRNEDPRLVGFQYVDFMIEGEDIIYLCRTAINGAHNFHDANQQTFHRVKRFRGL